VTSVSGGELNRPKCFLKQIPKAKHALVLLLNAITTRKGCKGKHEAKECLNEWGVGGVHVAVL
jgi:hypothetical protein